MSTSNDGAAAPLEEPPSGAPPEGATPAPSRWRIVRLWHGFEDTFISVLLAAMVLLALTEILFRQFGTGVPGALAFVQHLTLWVGFLGAAIAARQNRLLALATGQLLPDGRWREIAKIFVGCVSVAVSTLLCVASIEIVSIEKDSGTTLIEGVPTWVGQLAMPVAFGLLAWRLLYASAETWTGRALPFASMLAALAMTRWWPYALEGAPALPGLLLIVGATLLGGPIYVALGGVALLMFLTEGGPAAAIPAETYRLSVSPTLAAIPLFTLTGFLLAEGEASARLLRVFRALVGWLPGGTAVVCAVVCAFFTVFTGGSGVTILALGGLLFHALTQDNYRDRFSLGLLTASGSLGLLIPPALPLILYGIVASQQASASGAEIVPIEDLFIAGILPGLLLVGLISLWGMREGLRGGVRRTPFSWSELRKAAWEGKWDLALPFVVLITYFGGIATLVESAAVAATYAFFVQCVVHRDLKFGRPLIGVLQRCSVLVGGVLIILGVAMGLTSWIVDAQLAAALVDLVQNNIESKLVFLLVLNLFLLIVGCLMDIFSATVVVVPLILPLGVAFGIDPIHLGIIFIANLELGYLTPPVGLNLFLASYRFERPLLEVYRAAVPMLIILGVGVLLITYVPELTLGLLSLLGR